MSDRKLVITIRDNLDEKHINYLFQTASVYIGQNRVYKYTSPEGKRYIEINGSNLETVDDRVTFNVGVNAAINYIEEVNKVLDRKDRITYEEEEKGYKGWQTVKTNLENEEGV